MDAKIPEFVPEFEFFEISGAASKLRVKNLETNKLIDTPIVIFKDDIGLSSELGEIITKIAEKGNELSADSSDVTKSAIEDAIQKSLTEDAVKEHGEMLKNLVSVHIDMLIAEQLSKYAMRVFNEYFGENTIEGIIKARYSRVITPNILFIIKLISFISEYSSLFAAKNLSESISRIKDRTRSV